MKVRTGFVSNSSSTSFTCNVCGTDYVLTDDMELSDIPAVICENNHHLCAKHLIDASIADIDDCSYAPAQNCPICQFKCISKENIIKYLFQKNNVTMKDVEAEILEKFQSNTEFQDFLKKEE
jgi:hypothetical protein